MLRRDLKPGDLFYYGDDGPDRAYIAHDDGPHGDEAAGPVSRRRNPGYSGALINSDVTRPAYGPGEPAASSTSPAHYADLKPEPLDVIESWGLNFHAGQVLKYIARAGRKPGNPAVQDLEKARVYLDRWIRALSGA